MKVLYSLIGWMGMTLALISCSSSPSQALPDNPEKFVADCVALFSSGPGQVPSSQWPDSVAALHPLQVRVASDYIIVTLKSEEGLGSTGYVVSQGGKPDIENTRLTETPYSGLYLFNWTP